MASQSQDPMLQDRGQFREVMVFDYDGTLTLEDGTIPGSIKEILTEIKEKDIATMGIVSGRDLQFLKRVNSSLSDSLSFLVAENGAISYFEDNAEKTTKGEDWTKLARLVFSNPGFPIYFFEIIASASRVYHQRVREVLRKTSLEAKIVLNKDSVMMLPPNVDKGTGVSSAVAHYGPTNSFKLTCFGDGENDEALFGAADFSVAVSNAVPTLKQLADHVTTLPGGLGVEQYLRQKYFPPEEG
ncbi:MAG: HAD family hydrolase [Nitrososphaerales archaeon]